MKRSLILEVSMKLTHIFLVFSVLSVSVPLCRSDEGTTTSTPNITIATTVVIDSTTPVNITSTATTITEKTESTVKSEEDTKWGYRGLYGGSYYNYLVDNPNKVHYIHGVYQQPIKYYYSNNNYFRHNTSDTALDYYLGFGLSKMTDTDFKYNNFHHYYHNLNRTISENETIRMDLIISCNPNVTLLCPENTETVCLLNGTIYCMSKMSSVVPCVKNITLDCDNSTVSCAKTNTTNCVNSTIPCVKKCDPKNNYLEEISLPCLADVTIVDIYEDKNGMTISKVSGTFILVPALNIEDRMFCVTVIVDPVPP